MVTITGVTKTKRVNVAKGKKVKTILDAAKVFNKLNVEQKTAVIKNLDKALEERISPNGLKVEDKDIPATKQLRAWCMVNLMVGNELCPPENLHLYQ